jgi:hypothetical protein
VIGQLRLAEPTTWVVPLPRELLPESASPETANGAGDLNLGFLSSALELSGEAGKPTTGFSLERISIVPRPASLSDPSVVRDGHGATTAVARWFQSDDAAALPAAVEAALGMDAVTLARSFESLGTTAEFGIAQRNLGLSVVNFFRFCYIPLPGLFRALADDLREVVDPTRIAIERAGTAYPVLTLAAYNSRWPIPADSDNTASPLDHAMTLGYLRRKFFEGLRSGRKIYVVSRRRAIPTGQALALLMELHRHGPATLLCVEQDTKRAGEIDVLMPGLMRGYMAALAPDTLPAAAFGASPEPVDTIGWWRLMANAALAKRDGRRPEAA